MLTPEGFDALTDQLKDKIRFLYFHLMGEPFLHPHLPVFIQMAKQKGMIPVLTTNGTLLAQAGEVIAARPHKIQISLHSQEGNGKKNLESYINEVMTFAHEAAMQGIIVVLRLWNQGGYEAENENILKCVERHQPQPWTLRHDGWKLKDHLYLEYDSMFEWPDTQRDEIESEEMFCYALRNQLGVLVDGSVVPCCLDHDGDIVLGNLFEQTLDEILHSPRAQRLYEGFTRHQAVEPLCQRCGYAALTKQYRR